jgi:hypothetical protein
MNLIMRGRRKLFFLTLSSVAVLALAACTGDDGSQGIQGPKGDPGAAGNPGAPGAAGAAGNPGEPGLSGAPGNPGNPGPAGAQGAQGVAGETGPRGASGADANSTSLIVVDAGTGAAGFVEHKAAGTTEANVVGSGFIGSEVISLHAGNVFFDAVTANGEGAFSVTVDLSGFAVGSIRTLEANGEIRSSAAGGFVIVDKVSTD